MKPKILGIIPARGGSKGVPRKNIRLLAGKPLIAWTIEAAKSSEHISRLILSSDDEEILTIAKNFGCEVPFIRPKEYASDESSAIDVVMHAMNALQESYDYLVYLQPTSPLKRTKDIDGAIAKCIKSKVDTCVSVTSPDKSPYWSFRLDDENKLIPLIPWEDKNTRRQDVPESYILNGAIYVAKTEAILKHRSFIHKDTIGFYMPRNRSVDVDAELDFVIAEYLLHNSVD